MKGVHCDGPGCHTWATPKTAKKAGFMVVHWDGSKWHFCSWDCVMRYAATREPMTVVES